MYREAIINQFIKPLDREMLPYVGVELELPIVNLRRAAVSYDAVQAAAEQFVQKFHFRNVKRDDLGRIWFAEDPATQDTLSFDCSYNTLEWSFGREFDIHVLEERFRKYYAFTQKVLESHGHMLTGMGINPRYMLNRREPVASKRYQMLYQFLRERPAEDESFPVHDYPWFGMFSAASQVQMDVDKRHVIEVIETFNLLEPVKGLLFANSVWPENPDILINRDWLWEYSMHGLNARNVGMWNEPVRTIEELTDYLCRLSLFCTERDGKYLYFGPLPAEDYFSRETITGKYVSEDGVKTMTFRPEDSDIHYLRSYKYIDLTYRGTVEFRSACAQPVSETFAVAAFHAGLMQNLSELKKILSNDCSLFRQGMSPKVLRTLLSRRSLPASLNKSYLSELLFRILDLARDGLYRRGYKEADYLNPLYLRAEQLSNPAREYITGLEKGRTPESFIREYGQLDRRLSGSVRREFYHMSGIGLEEESLRVSEKGFVADTPHPIADDPMIDRDFSEAQVEMVTSVKTSPEKLYEAILAKRKKVISVLDEGTGGRELLWPFSVPPYLEADEAIPVARYTDDLAWKSQYRDYLAGKYGKRKMLFSGIHFNFSYPEYYLRERFKRGIGGDYSEFVSRRYLDLAEKSAAYSWLIAALMAASPVHDASFWDASRIGKTGISGYASLRTSEHGYWNHFVPVFDYSSISSYIDSIRQYVQDGLLKEERELYYPIRLKPYGEFSVEGFREGISHIEYRMIDLNPLSAGGIDPRDLSFLVLFITWLEYQPPVHADAYMQRGFVTNVMEASRAPLEDVSLQDLDGTRIALIDYAERVLREMQNLLGEQPAILFQLEKLHHPEKRYASILQARYRENFVERAIADARTQSEAILREIRTETTGGMYI